MKATVAACAILIGGSAGFAIAQDHLTYHGSAARSGWRSQERVLTPRRVAAPDFGLRWETPPLDSYQDMPPRFFASPLYVERLDGHSVVFAASTTGFVYAVNARDTRGLRAGAILWRRALTTAPCANGTYGILATPVIDRRASRLYVSVCEQDRGWRVHALDLRSGGEQAGWPVAIDAAAVNAPGININGRNQFPAGFAGLQRGALNLGAGGRWLYLTFGGEPMSGWLVALDTVQARIVSAFSATAATEEGVGGMWGSSGVSIDAQGDVFIATGSSVINALAGKGAAGVYPYSDGNWGQSIVRLTPARDGQLRLSGTYTPFNYCIAGGNDLDLGAGAPLPIDLPRHRTSTPQLLVQAGNKQGNAYLVDRSRMPGSLVRRQACSVDAASDRSLLAPEPQPMFGTRGPLNVFGPYSDRFGMGDLAKSRSTPAYFRGTDGRHFIYATGGTKAALDSARSVAPGLVRLEIVAQPQQPAYLRVDRAQPDVVFHNPGSPVVSSRGSRDAIVWVLDMNKPRTASLYGPDAPQPVLYAFDAGSLALVWHTAQGQLGASGKYNEPLIAAGLVVVGTDRIQAFGPRGRAPNKTPASGAAPGAPAPDRADGGLGARLYAERCAGCHEPERPEVPSRSALSALGAAAILEELRVGTMRPLVLGMPESDLLAIANYLAGNGN